MFNNKHLQNLSTWDVLSGLMNGQFPLQDSRSKGYYYLQPKRNQYGQEEDEMEKIHVPSATTPNPTWNNHSQNIQNKAATSPYNSTSMGWNKSLDATSSTTNATGTQYASNGALTQHNTKSASPFDAAITQEFKDQIGALESESSGGYQAYTPEGGSMGALGKYQFRKPALQDLGFVNSQGQWQGKDNINNRDDFLSNPHAQEEAANKYFQMNGKQLEAKCKASDYIGQTISGISGQKFPISASGLLAASHRMGSGNVCNYMNALDQNSNGNYYMKYDNLDPHKDNIFKAIETRLRRFAG